MKLKRNILIGAGIAGLGGALGATFRALAGADMVTIFFVNVLGCLFFGFFMRMLQRRYTLNHHFTEFLLTGFCGGFTTFSTVIAFITNFSPDEYVLFALYVLTMSVVGMLALALGAWIATRTVKIG